MILCVSRLDAVAGDHVLHVLKMAEQIYNDTPHSSIVIVGGGSRYEEFCKIADGINAKTRKEFHHNDRYRRRIFTATAT